MSGTQLPSTSDSVALPDKHPSLEGESSKRKRKPAKVFEFAEKDGPTQRKKKKLK
jgi:hypothetical protein